MLKRIFGKNKFFFVMFLVNVALGISAGIMFLHFMSKSDEKLYENRLQNMANNVSDVTYQLDNYLYTQGMIIDKYAEYIDYEHLTMEEAVNYLLHWRDFYFEIDLVNTNTLEGVSMRGERYGRKCDLHRRFKMNKAIKEVVDQYAGMSVREIREDRSVHLTDAFRPTGIDEYVYGMYQFLELDGEKYLLMFMAPISSLKYNGLNVSGLNGDNGFLMNRGGIVLVGNLRNNDKNYYANIEKYNSVEKKKRVMDVMRRLTKGRFTAQNELGEKDVCFFSVPKTTDGWVYVYRDNISDLTQKDENYIRSIRIIALLVFWLIVDLVGYFIYNRKLSRVLEEMDEKNRELQDANNAKNIFISNMSHEIRTPINAIIGMDEMILRECNDKTIIGYGRDIKNASKVLLGIINDILDYSRIDLGKMEIVPGDFDIGIAAFELYNIVKVKAKEKQLLFTMEINPQIPRILYGDEIRIKQIMINLLINAVKYTEKGSIQFKLDYESQKDGNIILKTSVKDTGIGIKEEDREKLFAAFERLDLKRNRSIEGTGLGMSIVTKLLEQMGSSLCVESVYGEGSEFSFALKLSAVGNEVVGSVKDIKERAHLDDEDTTDILSECKAVILGVDDSKVNLLVLKSLLKRTGITVETADSGQNCLEMCANKKYDLIFMDHRMPEMDGIETLHKLREQAGPNQDTTVIALTANVVSGAMELYMQEGFADFISKPIVANSLEKALVKYLPKETLKTE